MAYFDVTIKVRVEAANDREAEDFVMDSAQKFLPADGVFLVDSEIADEDDCDE